ncbi:4-carboxymuconolactone decarboxylase [Paraburkholderia caledonica]|nr:4-carboxymuconolactone decarboxylase [Burkholderia sp. Bk]
MAHRNRQARPQARPQAHPISRLVAVACVAVLLAACTNLERTRNMQDSLTTVDLKSASPAFERYTNQTVLNGLWKRPQLSARDRSIVTLSVLIARNQTIEMPFHFGLALDNGVTPAEISEMIAHLAFYSGWANATAASAIVKRVFDERGIGLDQLSPADVEPLPLNEAAEKQRAEMVQENFGAVAPGVVQYTTDALFRDLWLRPGLAPRDRSLVTVSALVANGQVAQIPYHLNRAMDNGLTNAEASEMLTQLAFYAGWPNVFSAMPVFKEVLLKRSS